MSPAFAQDAPVVSMFVAGDEQSGPLLSYFVEDCGECVIAQFSCGDGGGVAVTLLEFDDQTLAKWLTENGAHATLKVGDTSLDLNPQQIAFSEMSGAWDIKFVAWGNDATAIEPMAAGKAPVITTLKGDIALPAREGDAANARQFIDACRKRQQSRLTLESAALPV
jgi:hypothetical protein